jgi:uncharacterized Zn finger protein
MFTLPLTEAIVRRHTTPDSFQRGVEYGREGNVLALVQRGDTLEGEVQGSEAAPYRVRCVHQPDGSWRASCTCPYAYGGWCKHIVAACLTALRMPAKVEQRPTLADELGALTREQLLALLLSLADQDAHLAERIEQQIALQAATGADTPTAARGMPRRPPPDLRTIRRQVQAAKPSYDDEEYAYAGHWGNTALNTLQPILERARADIAADDGATALAVLEALTDPLVEDFEGFIEFDEEGESIDVLRDLGAAWMEAIVTARLDADAREGWAAKLGAWQEAVADYDDAFIAAIAAAQQGWDFPPLKRVLQGKAKGRAWQGEPPEYADALTAARLRVLARRGQREEYLRLARAEGQTVAYLTMLAHLGRADEALSAGVQMVRTPAEALALARALFAQGAREHAFQIAEHGLTLPIADRMMFGYAQYDQPYFDQPLSAGKVDLAAWLRDAAAEAGQTARALAAAQVAFREDISLAHYQRVQELAGDAWPALRADLLVMARRPRGYPAAGQIDVLLYEGQIDDAIAVLGEGHVPHELLARVADAALPTRADWVRDAARRKAEALMDEGKSKYYADAAHWLERARAAYRALGEEGAWQVYHAAILARHKRKYSLRPLIERLK